MPDGSTDQHRLVTFVDPLTGHARLIIGDDQGVFTGVDDNGTFIDGIGTAIAPIGTRNGNLRITQFYYGAVQPSLTAATNGRRHVLRRRPGHRPADLQRRRDRQRQHQLVGTSLLAPRSGGGDGTGVATDPTGSGTVLPLLRPGRRGHQLLPGQRQRRPVHRPDLRPGPDAERPRSPVGQRPARLREPGRRRATAALGNFAVNPIDGNQIIISSNVGRIFRTEDQGKNWFVIGEPSQAGFDGTYAPALAFGAPDPNGAGRHRQPRQLHLRRHRRRPHLRHPAGGGSAATAAWTTSPPASTARASSRSSPARSRAATRRIAVTQGGPTSSTCPACSRPQPPRSRSSGNLPIGVTTLPLNIPAPTKLILQDLTVNLDISYPVQPSDGKAHGNDSDLSFFLIGPDGTRIELAGGIGGTGQGFTGTSFNDKGLPLGGNPAPAAPFTGVFKPFQSLLANFGGKNIEGTWHLEIDNNGSDIVARLNSWSLTFSSQGGVYYNPDSTNPNAYWQNITGDLFNNSSTLLNVTAPASLQLRYLEALQVDWRYVIPADPGVAISPTNPAMPVLYVGGQGGSSSRSTRA